MDQKENVNYKWIYFDLISCRIIIKQDISPYIEFSKMFPLFGFYYLIFFVQVNLSIKPKRKPHYLLYLDL
jgi:hypothetical protein